MTDSSTPALDFAHFYHLLLSKAWLIILTVILSLLAAVAYLAWAPKIYESRAILEVAQEAPRINNIQDFNADGSDDIREPDFLKTIEQAMLSQTLLLRVVKANGLDKDATFAPPKPRNAIDRYQCRRFRSEAGKATYRVRGQGVHRPEL
jgi:uncharacterized protein involved in exopolysaccharide biosynthesis